MSEMKLGHWKGLLTEIGAGKSLFGDPKEKEIWNGATDRAMRIVERYRDGQGLFQLVEKKGDAQ